MKLSVQAWACLAGAAGVAVVAFSLNGERGNHVAVPRQAAVAAPAVPLAGASAASAAELAPTIARPASAAKPSPPADVSRMQRDIQRAVSSDLPGKAGEAARQIQLCMNLERNADKQRKFTDEMLRRVPEGMHSQIKAHFDGLAASCQAVDGASREQLVPLLRRSLAEGDKGAAAALVRALGADFNPANEPSVLPALRRDAWACDRSSQTALLGLVRRDPKLLTPDETGALRDQQRIQFAGRMGTDVLQRKAEGDPARQAAIERMILDSYKPPPEADPAEVARLSAEIQSRCEAEPGQSSNVQRAKPG